MAKIENTTVYPTVLPAASDLLIATDVSNDNKTVTFLVSDIVGGGGVAQDLQSVLDTGNTAIESINLTGNILVTGTVYPTTITAIGSTGGVGQILSSTGSGIQWINSPNISCCDWDSSLSVGNTATQDAFVQSAKLEINSAGGEFRVAAPATMSISGSSFFTGSVNINNAVLGFNATGQISAGGSVGTAGQWLTSTGTSVAWSSLIPASSCCDIQATLGAGEVAFNQGISFTGASSVLFGGGVSIGSLGNNIWSGTNTFSGILDVDGCLEDSLGSCGVAGQILTSTGSAVQWGSGAGIGAQNLQGVLDTAPFGATGANANVTISGTLDAGTITDNSGSTGSIGQILSMSGSGLTWITGGSGAVTSVTATNLYPLSTGAPLLITPTTGAVIVAPQRYGGGTNEGFVPRGATGATQYLDGSGSWSIPAGVSAGVTDIFLSSALFNTTAITSGALINNVAGSTSTLTLLKYNGGSDIGIVPEGGTSSTFLRGDGNWITPAGGSSGNSFTEDRTLYTNKLETNPTSLNTYCKFSGISAISPQGYITTAVGTASPTTWTDVQQSDAYWFGNGTTGGCSTSNDLSTLCGIGSIFISQVAAIYTFELWKANVCIGSTVVKAGELIVDYTVINTIACREWTIGASPLNELTTNDFYFVTLKTNIPSVTTVEMRMTNSIQRILS